MRLLSRKTVRSPDTGETHFDRLVIVDCRWFGIALHWLRRPDHDRDMHDHPWSFASVVLRGYYAEVVPCQEAVTTEEVTTGRVWRAWLPKGPWVRERLVFNGNRKRADCYDCHRISFVYPGTITLVIRGPKTRGWGFHTKRGWIPEAQYLGDAPYRGPDGRFARLPK